MEKIYDVVALGELLVDFTESGKSEQGNTLWEANPGGAPCNVLAMLCKLGRCVSFIGRIGNDVYGRQLETALVESGIYTSGLSVDEKVHTTLAIVSRKDNGDRDFTFYRDPGADMMLSTSDVPAEQLSSCRIFHFGTLSMTHEAVRAATKFAVNTAKENGALISFDPNLRPRLWDTPENMRAQMQWGLGVCDILKISDDELAFFTAENSIIRGMEKLCSAYPSIRLVNVTAGPDGSYCVYRGGVTYAPAARIEGTVETTGAGDTYCACILNALLDKDIDALGKDDIQKMMRFAAAAAAIITTRKGALRVMPCREEIEKLLAEN
ncbi:MAG: carbohydrate kinase [Clostridia bacterium]|nr:carbohydrate kinase [Clostridia bacterium]